MKKAAILVIIAAVATFLVVGISGSVYIWKNFSGAGPAFTPPDKDAVALGNTTGLPLKVPEGSSLSIFADGLVNPRVLRLTPGGVLAVSVPEKGAVYALPDKNADGKADEKKAIIEGLNEPHGLEFYCPMSARTAGLPADPGVCWMYVAEPSRVVRYDFDIKSLTAKNGKEIIKLPGGKGHNSHSLLLHANAAGKEQLLISVGSTCNVCNEKDERRATVMKAGLDGKNPEVFAKGLRNAAFMTQNFVDGAIWVSEMGRDYLGDDLPPDEINRLEEGANFGWPTCYGKNIHDTDFDKNTYVRNPCMEPFEIPSFIDLPAHSAPLGLAFIPEDPPSGGWPEDWWYDLLVAYHGSWNRSVPTGYKIVRHRFNSEGLYQGGEDFITGWIDEKGETLGRPVDILLFPGGTGYISDDKAGVIYAFRHNGKSPVTPESPPPAPAASDLIKVEFPARKTAIRSPITISGQARGTWYFEASFPVEIHDGSGKVIGQGAAQAQGEWMTENFVPFTATIKFTTPKTKEGAIILRKDNPSGLPERDAHIEIPIVFEPASQTVAKNPCRPTGCSNQICSDEDVMTTCEYRAEYSCYRTAVCERQTDGECGWTMTQELKSCIADPPALESAQGTGQPQLE